MASLFRAGNRLSSGSIGFITRRSAWLVAAGAASVAMVPALVAGIMIGVRLPVHHVAGDPKASRVERDYAIDQLGKLNASVAQIEPRIARLTAQVGALHDFEARLKTPRPAPGLPAAPGNGSQADPGDSEGEGGPSLPPRRCGDIAAAASAPAVHAHAHAHGDTNTDADADHTREQLACMSATLSALERQTAGHAMAYAAFPGRMPADGARFGSPFGNRIDPFTQRLSFHPGLDLVARTGTPILAAAGGRVVFAGEKSGYGNAVEIDHGNGLMTRYGHASKIVVQVGDLVLPRQFIAEVGSTGRSTGPHLHFEVLVNGAPVNPAAYLALFAPIPHG
jgi:murein DD-endopeptidase MepM/ murein hydrolase activator NlpD